MDGVVSMKTPWIEAGEKVLGLHEIRDIEALSRWLKSDGRALGNPSKMPWCGDFVDTAISRALPDEPRPGALGVNVYWALNWGLFGVDTEACYGCVGAKKRQGGGHVFFIIGETETHYRAFGGNQNNMVTRDAWIPKSAVVATRWPVTYTGPKLALPKYQKAGGKMTEA